MLRCLKLLATWLFVQQLVQANIKLNIKALHYWPFVRGTTGHWWFPSQRASNVESVPMLWRIMHTVHIIPQLQNIAGYKNSLQWRTKISTLHEVNIIVYCWLDSLKHISGNQNSFPFTKKIYLKWCLQNGSHFIHACFPHLVCESNFCRPWGGVTSKDTTTQEIISIFVSEHKNKHTTDYNVIAVSISLLNFF